MRKINLKGLERAVKELNKTIIITRDDFSKKHIDKDVDIKIQILHEGRVVDSVSTSNLIKGLIVLSNHYLEELIFLEDVKKKKAKLERIVRKGAEVEISNFTEKLICLKVKINGDNKYNFYAENFTDVLASVEDLGKTVESHL